MYIRYNSTLSSISGINELLMKKKMMNCGYLVQSEIYWSVYWKD